jgi:hypothetical protein
VILGRCVGGERVKFVDFQLNGVEGHPGYLGEYLDLSIDYLANNEEKTKKFFVKMLPMFCDSQRKVLEETRIFIKEIWVYSKILAVLGNNSGN